MKYSFHLFWFATDYYRFAYSDLSNLSDIVVHWGIESALGNISKQIFRAHNAPATNKLINLPFKKVWFPYLINLETSDKPYCFVFTPKFFYNAEQCEFVNYLKARFPDCKTVLYYQDIASSHTSFQQGNDFWKRFDQVVTYDKDEAIKYGFGFYPTSYSLNIKNKLSLDRESSDVLFVGRAKDRLSVLVSIYDFLEGKGLKCKFLLAGVAKPDRIERANITYLDKNISYKENLEYVANTKCVLDMLQGGATGCSFRFWESIAFGINILTNNTTDPIGKMPNRIIFSENTIKEIDIDAIMKTPLINDEIKEKLSPVGLIKYIESVV